MNSLSFSLRTSDIIITSIVLLSSHFHHALFIFNYSIVSYKKLSTPSKNAATAWSIISRLPDSHEALGFRAYTTVNCPPTCAARLGSRACSSIIRCARIFYDRRFGDCNMLRVGAAPRAEERHVDISRRTVKATGCSCPFLSSAATSPSVRNTLLRIPSEWGEY